MILKPQAARRPWIACKLRPDSVSLERRKTSSPPGWRSRTPTLYIARFERDFSAIRIPWISWTLGTVSVLSVINVFSKYLHVVPLKTKTGPSETSAFRSVLNGPRYSKPVSRRHVCVQRIWQTIFLTGHVARGHSISRVQDPDVKCAVVERAHRTLRNTLYRYFTNTNSYRFLEVLPQFVKAFNDTVLSAIGIGRCPRNSSTMCSFFTWNSAVILQDLEHTFHTLDISRRPGSSWFRVVLYAQPSFTKALSPAWICASVNSFHTTHFHQRIVNLCSGFSPVMFQFWCTRADRL